MFEGVRGKSYRGDIAVDDIAVKDGFCPPLKECTFEDVRMCGWTQEKRYYHQTTFIFMYSLEISCKKTGEEKKKTSTCPMDKCGSGFTCPDSKVVGP